MTPVVDIKGMSFSYVTQPILERVDLTVPQRDFACVVGPNGGGKTTLLKIILGLLQPYEGTVSVFGVAPLRARARIGYVPQYQNFDMHFPVRVLDVVLMGTLSWHRILGPYRSAEKSAGRQALRDVGLGDLEYRPFSALSGGQRQRALIARALVGRPDLLLLDEPTAHVDVVAGGEIYNLLCELNRNMTVMMVSHDLGFVAQCIKSVICVNRRVVAHPTSEITGDIISDIYGQEVRVVRHDHGGASCPTGGAKCSNL